MTETQTEPGTVWPGRTSIRAMPKAEVHVHLEGCFEVVDVIELAGAAKEPLPRPPERLFDFGGFDHFLDFLGWMGGLVRTPEQAARVAYRFAAREAASGVRYADVVINLTHWPAWRDRRDQFIDALDAGFRGAEEDGLTKVGVCLSVMRQQTAQEAVELAEWMVDRRHPRVVALSIDGNEAAIGRTSPRFAEAFRIAGEGGLKRAVHAGESSGPEGVRDAIDILGADRIDHGVRAVEDNALVRELADRQIPLCVCVGSNVIIGLAPDRRSHPADELRRAGVKISLNTDDPAYYETSLEDEYLEVTKAYSWTPEILRSVARNAVETAFCDDGTRADLLADLASWDPIAAAG